MISSQCRWIGVLILEMYGLKSTPIVSDRISREPFDVGAGEVLVEAAGTSSTWESGTLLVVFESTAFGGIDGVGDGCGDGV
jgi:hypothetical protein